MVQWDSSEHNGLEGRGPQLSRLAMIDNLMPSYVPYFGMYTITELGPWAAAKQVTRTFRG